MAKKHKTKQKGGNVAEKLLTVLILIGVLWFIGKIVYEQLCASWWEKSTQALGDIIGARENEEKRMICGFLRNIPGYK